MSEVVIYTKDGAITNKPALKKFFDELLKFSNGEGKYLISGKNIKKRSIPQNSYYWLIMTDYIQPALYNQGWREIKTKEAAHLFVSELFLKVNIVNEQTGEMKQRIRSTTELTTLEFNEYLEEIWQWAAEWLLITIPSPKKQIGIEYPEPLLCHYDINNEITIVQ